MQAIKDFFRSRVLLKQTNFTTINLVPKVANPKCLNEYRLITCCNVIYKVISKVLAARLRGVLDGIIDPSQSAFILGR